MKEWMRKVIALIDFDFQKEYICRAVQKQMLENPLLSSYEEKLLRWHLSSDYWLKKVPVHFFALLTIGMLVLVIVDPGTSITAFPVMIVSAIVTCSILIFTFYLPYFVSIFLPEVLKVQQLGGLESSKELEKCRKAQLPNPTLVLIWYVLAKTSRINSLKSSETCAGLLNQLYGVDQRSIKSSMDLFLGSSRKRKQLKGRAKTEIENRFAEAYQFFKALQFERAESILKELEIKCLTRAD